MYVNATSGIGLSQRVRVFCDGTEYTRAAKEADDEHGYVRGTLWKGYPNPPGEKIEFVVKDGKPEEFELRGEVSIVIEPLPELNIPKLGDLHPESGNCPHDMD